jgi:thiol-disulfide isomerase/thioredoxin
VSHTKRWARFPRVRDALQTLTAVAAIVATSSAFAAQLIAVEAKDLAAAIHSPGHPTLVHVWASWCVPCVAEWPRLAEAMRSLPPPVEIVTVALDGPETRPRAIEQMGRLGPLRGRALAVPIAAAFGTLKTLDPDWDGAIPTTYVLDAEGRIVLAQRGATRLAPLTAAVDEQLRASRKGHSVPAAKSKTRRTGVEEKGDAP